MTINHDDFLQRQIAQQLRGAKFSEAVAVSSAMAAVDHQRSNPNMKLLNFWIGQKNMPGTAVGLKANRRSLDLKAGRYTGRNGRGELNLRSN